MALLNGTNYCPKELHFRCCRGLGFTPEFVW